MLLAAAVLIWGFAPGAPRTPACAAKDTAFLAALAGEWEVDAEFRAGESIETATGRASIHPELGGCVFVERYDGTRSGKAWAFLAILGANGGGGGPDPAKPIQEVFVHSQHGILSLSSGRVDGTELVVEDAATVDGRIVLNRHVHFAVSPRAFRYESRRSTDRGGTWTVTRKARDRRKD